MAVSKVIYGDETLIDLTADTVKQDRVLKNYTFHGADGVQLPGTCDYDANTQDATASEDEILNEKVAYVRGVKVAGKMKDNGAVAGMISKIDGKYTVPQGYHDGSGTVQIDPNEQAKLTADNIREGVEVLGVRGSMSGSENVKATTRTVKPTIDGFTVLPGDGFNYLTSVAVDPIPVVRSDNAAGGKTVTIG